MKDILTKPVAALRRRNSNLVASAPVDLFGVAAFVIGAAVLLAVVDVSSTVARAAVGFPLLFLVPGYVTVSLLFPRAAPVSDTESSLRIAQVRHVSDVERVALSFGLSVALLPLLGLALAVTPWGYTTGAVVGTVSCFALITATLAVGRRLAVPPTQRYQVEFGRRLRVAHSAIFDTKSTLHTAVNIVLVLSILIAITTVGYALIAPQQGEEYTDLQLLTENESGELVAADYPNALESNETATVTAAIENREGESTEYTIVVQEQWIDDGEVLERTTTDSTEVTVADGENETEELQITPTADDGTVRFSVLLYDGSVPDTPTNDNAYRDTYFWTDVAESTETASQIDGDLDVDDGDEAGDDEEADDDDETEEEADDDDETEEEADDDDETEEEADDDDETEEEADDDGEDDD
ncbi:DUF1616 domain-containing protein [Natronolimnohabitans sp. A-GB9]|uniref:DUF1616 domain-containing protein n=1 Tax=Natronolimnohabitans sp. A-GB9 TaxID=3069757 RepID=UPI0027B44F3A|nr:DUF1616 domain-containing protein [Natronolimnohabitans sp. A-GB9]MDQ2052596.1 DUF1616 domain-containing protein [Natronolimnohabitans sp. A-GB9]